MKIILSPIFEINSLSAKKKNPMNIIYLFNYKERAQNLITVAFIILLNV